MDIRPSRKPFMFGAVLSAAVLLSCTAVPANAAPASPYTVKSFAAVGSESKPDDITRLGNNIYVAFQNGVGPMGEPSTSGATASTIQQYSLDGTPGASWTITGKIDGLHADEAGQRLLVTTNEDGNSAFHTVTPSGGAGAVKDFAYTGLTHGGGTDTATIYQGKIFITASNPSDTTGPAVYQATLSGSTAALAPVFTDNATATVANAGSTGTTALALTDPDSATVVPADSPRFKNQFALASQGDQQLIFADRAGTPQQSLQVLNLSQQVDDTAFATTSRQTLWITDPDHNTVLSVTGPFGAGQALSTVTPDAAPDYLAALDLSTGSLTPVPGLSSIHPKGLLFTSAH
ncbi:hypothetical protein BMF89_03785 [Arthrobacter sp. SRS-W-1-2016]|uniref:hypothetical protein n=1 Tax=Arthrobacter sp. SRS-W-1-2016 TaxID=1930254 RepID=UPI0009912B44|nr:hypothetical protein [Arthrobacter sp. SRS-W-1-2016]OOP64546.1 hypothetical protein BMF89_03785 [Arthrobacter sp. SRS-W-1-2016]